MQPWTISRQSAFQKVFVRACGYMFASVSVCVCVCELLLLFVFAWAMNKCVVCFWLDVQAFERFCARGQGHGSC